jgi:hypothetical protein
VAGMTMQPTPAMLREASEGVAVAGWEKTSTKGHPMRPRSQRTSDGAVMICQNCSARTSPARWPLFFIEGPHACQLLWTCSTCKNTQADRHGRAIRLVEIPDQA